MYIYYGFCVILFGLIFGSFLNCCAMRLVRGEDFVRGRSHCINCGHELAAIDLIPLFSYLITKGRCRYCKEKISIRYPITEITFAVLSLFLYMYFIPNGLSFQTVFVRNWILTGCMFVLSLTDIENYEIPDGVIITGFINWIVFSLIDFFTGNIGFIEIIHNLIAGILCGSVMLILSLIMDRILKKESLGGGDIKLYAMLSLYLGYFGAYELVMFSCVIGIIFGFLRKKKKRNLNEEFPFGPCICAAAYILLFYSETITEWYVSSFL